MKVPHWTDRLWPWMIIVPWIIFGACIWVFL